MATKFRSYRKESQIDWGATTDEATGLSLEQVNTGAFLRMADATEKMAGNFIRLQNDLEMYKRWYENSQKENRRLQKQVSGLKGAITKMKKGALNQ